MAIQKKTRQLLLILLIASLLNGISWVALIPMWQTPDEQAHFAQAQDIAAIGYRPNPGASTSQDIVLSEKYLGTFRDERGNNRFTYHPEYNIEYSNSAYGLYEKELMAMPVESRNIFAINEATGYPPLYYLYISTMNKQFWSLDLISRVFLSRVATALLSVGLGAVVFYIGKIVFKQIFYAYVLTVLVVFQPMRMFVGSGVTSDALMNLIYPVTILLLLKADLLPSWKNLTVLILALAALLLTKIQGVFLILISSILWLKVITGRKYKIGPKLISAVVLLVIAAAISIGIINRTTFGNVIPNLLRANMFIPEIDDSVGLNSQPFLIDYIKTSVIDFYRQVLPWYCGVYRWLSLTLPFWVYRVIKAIMLVSLFGWIIGFKKIKTVVNSRPLIWLIFSSAVYTLGIYAWNLLFWKSKGFSFGIQGRYFFPNLAEHMAILIVGLLILSPARFRKPAGLTVAALMIFFNWFSLWFISQSYYGSIINYQAFFLRASQYKPWFFKTPLLEVWSGLGIFMSLWFLWKMGVELFKQEAGNKKQETMTV
ncbi:DUF2142 domain-containing protein [Candidatus Collierbacteria bacterium]|nr:DUF2142 domain-containing protein [Candidatus Collierbacteria bacterium]